MGGLPWRDHTETLTAPIESPEPQAHPRMNHAGHDVREVPEPGLITSHVLVGLSQGSKAGLGVGIDGHRITDTTKLDQMGIKSSSGRFRAAH